MYCIIFCLDLNFSHLHYYRCFFAYFFSCFIFFPSCRPLSILSYRTIFSLLLTPLPYFHLQVQSTLPLTQCQGRHTISTPLYSRIWFQGPQALPPLISKHITATSTSPRVASTRTGWYRTNTETIVVRTDKVCSIQMCSMRFQRTRTGMCIVLTIVLWGIIGRVLKKDTAVSHRKKIMG